MFNLFLIVCFDLMIPILYFVQRNEVKPKKNIILGVTLTPAAQQDERVLAVCKTYLRRLRLVCAVLFVLPFGCMPIQYGSIVTLLLCIWLIPAIAVPVAVYALANRSLMKLKRENNWFSPMPAGKQFVVADLQAAVREPFRVHRAQFIISSVLSLVPVLLLVIFRRDANDFWPLTITSITFAVIVALCGPMCAFLIRRRADTVGENTDLNVALTRVRRRGWNTMWLLMAWLTLGLEFAMVWGDSSWIFLAAIVVYTAVLCVAALGIELHVRARQQELTAAGMSNAETPYADEDAFWIWGQFYYNKNDSHLIVNDRVGMNSSVNLARPAGKIFMGFAALLILLMPLLGVWMVSEEFSPISCTVSETELTVSHGITTYTVEKSDVQNVSVLEDLPDCSKQMGTNSPTLYKGTFRVDGYASCEVLLDPTDDDFLLIQTDRKTYIFSFRGKENVSALDESMQPQHA